MVQKISVDTASSEKRKEIPLEKPRKRRYDLHTGREMPKACDRCNAEFKGFGTTCAECRKTPDKNAGAPKQDGSGCAVCGKTVYPMEKTEIEGMLLHTACFRCKKCDCKLTPAKFARTPAGVFYCPTHYKELFRLRGKYDEDENGLTKAVDRVNGTEDMHTKISGVGTAEVAAPGGEAAEGGEEGKGEDNEM